MLSDRLSCFWPINGSWVINVSSARLTCGLEGTRDQNDEYECKCHRREVPAPSQVPTEVASEESNVDIAVGTGSYIKHDALAS